MENFKNKSDSFSPYSRFTWSINNFLRKCLGILSFDVLDKEFRRSFGYWFMAVWFFVAFICTAFSIFIHRNNLTSALQLVGAIGAIIQTSLKYSFVEDFKRLATIPNFIQEVYKKNSSDVQMANDETFKICDKYSRQTKNVCCFMICYVGVLIVFGSIQPILIYLFTNKMVTSIGIGIPGISSKGSTVEYVMNVVFETSILCLVCLVEVAVETIIIINFICLSMLSDIIRHTIATLEVDLNLKKLNAKSIEQKLVHIVLMHQKYIEAIAILNDGIFRPCLVLIICAFSFTTTAIYILATDNSVPIIPIIFLCHGLLQENCICCLGTLLTNSNDRIRYTMKTFDWHLLPQINLQKTYQTMLLHVERPHDIYIGGISRLSLETSVSIMRSLYSYTTLLLSMEN